MLFSELYKIMVNLVTLAGFRGGNRHPLDTPIVLNTRMLSEVPRTLGCRLSKYFVKRQL